MEIASNDAVLVKIHVNTETSKSLTILSEEKRILVAPSSTALRQLEHAYLEVARACSTAPLLLQHKHDDERRYGCFGVFSKEVLKSRTQTSGLLGIVSNEPEDVKYGNSFSVFLESNGEVRIRFGPCFLSIAHVYPIQSMFVKRRNQGSTNFRPSGQWKASKK